VILFRGLLLFFYPVAAAGRAKPATDRTFSATDHGKQKRCHHHHSQGPEIIQKPPKPVEKGPTKVGGRCYSLSDASDGVLDPCLRTLENRPAAVNSRALAAICQNDLYLCTRCEPQSMRSGSPPVGVDRSVDAVWLARMHHLGTVLV
jgi:hypothetical protein